MTKKWLTTHLDLKLKVKFSVPYCCRLSNICANVLLALFVTCTRGIDWNNSCLCVPLGTAFSLRSNSQTRVHWQWSRQAALLTQLISYYEQGGLSLSKVWIHFDMTLLLMVGRWQEVSILQIKYEIFFSYVASWKGFSCCVFFKKNTFLSFF